jgi:thiamine-phosphate pyrophosphorylase
MSAAGAFGERAPILCAITDRRRHHALVEQAAAAADAGLDLFQIREPDLPDNALLEIAERARDAAKGSALRVLLNDRLDIAIAAGAHGVHLRGSSFAAARARIIAPSRTFLIGRSVHSVDEAAAAEAAGGLDYLILGTMFPTISKPPDHPLAGIAALRAAVRACRLPILGIGGITLENAGEIAGAGAAGLAAISLFAAPRTMRETAARLRQIFAAAPRRA